jgi:hypothetical protein
MQLSSRFNLSLSDSPGRESRKAAAADVAYHGLKSTMDHVSEVGHINSINLSFRLDAMPGGLTDRLRFGADGSGRGRVDADAGHGTEAFGRVYLSLPNRQASICWPIVMSTHFRPTYFSGSHLSERRAARSLHNLCDQEKTNEH